MSESPVELRKWPRRRWWYLIGLILTVQVALIFWLSDSSPAPLRSVNAAPRLHLTRQTANSLFVLQDPTLFALPHRRGFSGPAWLRIPRQEFPSFEWREPPRWLDLPIGRPGAVLDQFVKLDRFDPLQPLAKPQAQTTLPELLALPLSRQRSTLRVEGSLAARQLVTPMELPAWPNADLLTNSIVHLLVDPSGQTFSHALLWSSGKREADEMALSLARTARFQSLIREGPGSATNSPGNLTSGKMIFEWQTILPANLAPAAPR